MIPEAKQKHIVLITDDSVTERAFISSSLLANSQAEVTIYESENQEELFNTLDRLMCSRTLPSLVILDFLLGTTHGVIVADRLRRNYPPIPVVVLGACLGSGELITKLYRLGVNGYIVKPQTEKDYDKIMNQIVDIWLHQPQPVWRFRGDACTTECSVNDRRRYDRRGVGK